MKINKIVSAFTNLDKIAEGVKNKIFKSAQLNILIFNQKRTKKVPHVNQEKKLTISNRIY